WFAENFSDLISKVSKQAAVLEAYGQLYTETAKAENALRTARLDLAALIAAPTDPFTAQRKAAPAPQMLEHNIKTALTSAASHLSYGRRLIGTVATSRVSGESDDDRALELNRLSVANRNLLAEIHRL